MVFNNRYKKKAYHELHKYNEPYVRYFFLVRFGSFWFVLKILVLIIFFSCSQIEPSHTEFALGTVCSVNLFEQGSKTLYDEIFNRICEIENLMSANIRSSDISRINAAAGIQPVNVSEETFFVIKSAVYIAMLSNGAFDPTIGPVVSLWGIGSAGEHIPYNYEIENLLSLVNWRNIELNESANSVFLTKHGMELDLGAIAKGYAADAASDIVKKAGIKRALIDLGGNIIIAGEKKDKSPWRVGLQNPYKTRGETIGYLQITMPQDSQSLTVKTVVTSGVYERFFEAEGNRYHHIFSPSLGFPVQNGLVSVTVTADVSMDADALSTAAFVLGYEKGSALIESLAGIEAVFVFEDRSVRLTSGADFILTDNTFSLKQ